MSLLEIAKIKLLHLFSSLDRPFLFAFWRADLYWIDKNTRVRYDMHVSHGGGLTFGILQLGRQLTL